MGEAIPVAAVGRLLTAEGEQREARRMAAKVLAAVADGRLMLRETQHPTWLWPGKSCRSVPL